MNLLSFFNLDPNQIKYFVFEHKHYAAKPIDEKYYGILKTVHDYAVFCRRNLPGKHSAQFISDLDVSKDPGMSTHRAVAYYLYPIDIRNIRQEPKDSLVVFKKNNPVQSVPDDFRVIGMFGETNLLAVKQEETNDPLLGN